MLTVSGNNSSTLSPFIKKETFEKFLIQCQGSPTWTSTLRICLLPWPRIFSLFQQGDDFRLSNLIPYRQKKDIKLWWQSFGVAKELSLTSSSCNSSLKWNKHILLSLYSVSIRNFIPESQSSRPFQPFRDTPYYFQRIVEDIAEEIALFI